MNAKLQIYQLSDDYLTVSSLVTTLPQYESPALVKIGSTSTTTYVFFGDRWNSNNLTDSRYIWQPLTINGTTVSMTCATSWKIDATTGVVSP